MYLLVPPPLTMTLEGDMTKYLTFPEENLRLGSCFCKEYWNLGKGLQLLSAMLSQKF